jgi:RNA polymerase sporulation-specific sigma factor
MAPMTPSAPRRRAQPDAARAPERLVALAQAGDEAAVTRLLAHSRPLIRQVAAAFRVEGHDHQDILSVARHAFLKALRNYDPARGVRWEAFLALVVRRELITALDRRVRPMPFGLVRVSMRRRVLEEHFPSPDPGSDPAEAVASASNVAEALEAVRKALSRREWRILEGVCLNGLTYPEMAEALGCSRKTIDNALTRARRKLRALGLHTLAQR